MKNNNLTIFICSKCDAQYPKWTGRCLTCGAWGTIKESDLKSENQNPKIKINSDNIISLKQIKNQQFERIKTKTNEFDNVLGGGFVPGSLNLLGGEPGIGKSTLVLQICQQLNFPVLYVSGEESAQQIKMRTDRLALSLTDLKFVAENNLEKVISYILKTKPKLVIIDSIQTLYSNDLPSEAGSVNQVRVCTVKLLEIAKQQGITIVIIGHITKEGVVAGPKTLEHLVDCVLYLESSKTDNFRILRCSKNRFGSTNEIGVFNMTGQGLTEINNPSELFLPHNQEAISGSTLACTIEGSRPFFIEIQALVTKTQFGYPQRKTSGFDLNRLQMLIAVLIKRGDTPLINQDVHLNITGGLKITETGIDLAVCLAIISSLQNKVIKADTIIIGEVGLGGEIRPVYQMGKRIEEAQKLKFKTIITPPLTKNKNGIIEVKNIKEAIKEI